MSGPLERPDFTCGTRRATYVDGAWRVVCATCGMPADPRYFPVREAATSVAVAQSAAPCPCGAR
jgi:hypothetical protein